MRGRSTTGREYSAPFRPGGYADLPLMEDVALIRELRRVTRVHLLDAAVQVSARRWEAEGPLRRLIVFAKPPVPGLAKTRLSPMRRSGLSCGLT